MHEAPVLTQRRQVAMLQAVVGAEHDGRRLRQPPRGHHWIRDDRGNMLMVAVATGIIADLLLHH